MENRKNCQSKDVFSFCNKLNISPPLEVIFIYSVTENEPDLPA